MSSSSHVQSAVASPRVSVRIRGGPGPPPSARRAWRCSASWCRRAG
ncbi:putative glucan 1,3-beta-glucosidase D, partial [Frankliniella fusca]